MKQFAVINKVGFEIIDCAWWENQMHSETSVFLCNTFEQSKTKMRELIKKNVLQNDVFGLNRYKPFGILQFWIEELTGLDEDFVNNTHDTDRLIHKLVFDETYIPKENHIPCFEEIDHYAHGFRCCVTKNKLTIATRERTYTKEGFFEGDCTTELIFNIHDLSNPEHQYFYLRNIGENGPTAEICVEIVSISK